MFLIDDAILMAEPGAYSNCGLDAGVKNEGKGEMYMFGNGNGKERRGEGKRAR